MMTTEGGEADDELELVGAAMTPTVDAVSAQGMAPREGRERVTQTVEGSCQGPFLSFSYDWILHTK